MAIFVYTMFENLISLTDNIISSEQLSPGVLQPAKLSHLQN